ncbi:hypothetical protein PCCS19_36880 [Paenibacillus sp. CCS19]|uniref:SRPBCC family protein n=1 Tax=Paenibacillus sp. CCS19 TaxID=3158387 RepID=UPI002564FC66|nr:SRPBCC family protein [Paenibacillus cellulosilyticus]GMK40632.1 hypothetical protein PCCS19_36880 [Paenibacillus cellulosilyticus]
MLRFEHEVITAAKVETIWKLYSTIESWMKWDAGIASVSLDGPFEVGTRGFLEPKGQGKLPFVLTEVNAPYGFSDITEIAVAGIEVHFSHRLERTENGTRITHSVRIDGPNAERVGARMIEHFAQGIPQTVASLAAAALELEV